MTSRFCQIYISMQILWQYTRFKRLFKGLQIFWCKGIRYLEMHRYPVALYIACFAKAWWKSVCTRILFFIQGSHMYSQISVWAQLFWLEKSFHIFQRSVWYRYFGNKDIVLGHILQEMFSYLRCGAELWLLMHTVCSSYCHWGNIFLWHGPVVFNQNDFAWSFSC